MAGLLVIHPEKFAEEFGEGLRRDPYPVVRYPHLDVCSLLTGAHGHLAAVRGKLQGVGEQVGEHLTEAVRISLDWGEGVRHLQTDSVFLTLLGK